MVRVKGVATYLSTPASPTYLLAVKIRMIRTGRTRNLAIGLLVHYIIRLTNEENLRTASSREACGINWKPISLCQSVEDAKLNSESDAHTVRALQNQ